MDDDIINTGNVEFFPRSPLYNDRVIPLAVVSLLPLIPAFGSFPVAVVALVGVAATYIADMMNFRRTTIALLVTTLVAIWVGFYLGNFVEIWSSVAPFVVLLNASLLMCLLAMWALLHVRWVVLRYPELSVRCERMVVGLLPFSTIPSLVSTSTALAGSRHAAFVFALVMCALHWLFFWRRSSSFAVLTAQQQQTAKEVRDICFVVHRPETFIFTALTMLMPTVLHTCFVWPTITHHMLAANAIGYSRWLWLVNAAGLVAIPCGYFLFFYKRALWFMRDTQLYKLVETHRTRFGVAAYFIGLFFGVSRVMHSRYSFYFTGFVPPFNFILLYATLAAVPVLVVLSLQLYEESSAAGKKSTKESGRLWGTCLLLSLAITVSFSCVVGMPPFFVMTSACSVAALWAYLIDRKRNAGQYTMFMFCSAIALLWWMFQSFSFVISDLKVFGEMGVIPVPLMAGSMLWVYVFGLWLVPLSFAKEAKFLFTTVLVFHSQKVLWIERVLYSQNEESTYPPQFVLVTTLAGSFAAYRLFKNQVLDPGPTSVVIGAYLSKVVVYFSDSVEIDYRFSDGSSPDAIIREALVGYTSWAAVSIILYAHLKKLVVPANASSSAFTRLAAASGNAEASEDALANNNNNNNNNSQEEGAAAAAESQNSPSSQQAGGEEGGEESKPLTQAQLKERASNRMISATLLTFMLYMFFLFSSPTLVRWFVQDLLRVPSPSRLQLLGAATVLATVSSWYMVLQLVEPASPSYSKVNKIFGALSILFFAMTFLDPPVEAVYTMYDKNPEGRDQDYQEVDGIPQRERDHLLMPDLPFQAPWWSRWVLLLALAVGIMLRSMLAVKVPHFVLRSCAWVGLGILLGLSVTGCNIIIADWKVYLLMCIYFSLTLLCFDQAHYSKLESSEMTISLFIGGLVSFVIGIFLLNRVDLYSITRIEVYLIDGVFASRIGAIGVLAVCNFAFAAAIKCRSNGFSLLPSPTPITSIDAVAQLSLVLSSACALGSVALILLAMLLGEGSSPLLLMAGGLLLFLEDRGWGYGIERGMRRYVLPFTVVSLCLWIKVVQEVRHLHSISTDADITVTHSKDDGVGGAATEHSVSHSGSGSGGNVLPYYVGAAMCVPSQIIVTLVLWRGGSMDPSVARGAAKTARGIFALVLLAVDLLVVIMTVSTHLRLIAAINLIGHVTRLSLLEGIITKAKETFL